MRASNQLAAAASVPDRPSIAAIMPVYNAEHLLPSTLGPLCAMRDRGEVDEILVIDDGSTDGSADVARSMGCTVLPSGGRKGPGGARNVAAQKTTCEILWFVDSDVIAHDNAASIVARSFDLAEVVALFGSYDDSPRARNFLSQYKNLVHHFYHQQATADAATFWAGCGAVRRSAFLAVGGFDVERYKYPSIEDIELGYRLRAAGGRIRFDPELQGKHLKEWRFVNLIHTEIFRRAIPWSRLILQTGATGNSLNVTVGERVRAAIAGILLLSLFAALFKPALLWVAITAAALALLSNLALVRLFARRNGMVFAVGGLLFHQLYYVYSASAFVWSVVTQPRYAAVATRPPA